MKESQVDELCYDGIALAVFGPNAFACILLSLDVVIALFHSLFIVVGQFFRLLVLLILFDGGVTCLECVEFVLNGQQFVGQGRLHVGEHLFNKSVVGIEHQIVHVRHFAVE